MHSEHDETTKESVNINPESDNEENRNSAKDKKKTLRWKKMFPRVTPKTY